MSRFDIKMKDLILNNSETFQIKRKSGGLIDGEWIEDTTEILEANLLITTMKKEDYDFVNIGIRNSTLLKVRQLRDDLVQLEEDDIFEYYNDSYKVLEMRPYHSHTSDFSIRFISKEVI
ncbi:MAG: hypothetical protein ACRC6E_08255 [Fusobacteriaceae bacterium]